MQKWIAMLGILSMTGCTMTVAATSAVRAKVHNDAREQAIERGDTDIPPPADVERSAITGAFAGLAIDALVFGVLRPMFSGYNPDIAGH